MDAIVSVLTPEVLDSCSHGRLEHQGMLSTWARGLCQHVEHRTSKDWKFKDQDVKLIDTFGDLRVM